MLRHVFAAFLVGQSNFKISESSIHKLPGQWSEPANGGPIKGRVEDSWGAASKVYEMAVSILLIMSSKAARELVN